MGLQRHVVRQAVLVAGPERFDQTPSWMVGASYEAHLARTDKVVEGAHCLFDRRILIKPVSDAVLNKVIDQWILKAPVSSGSFNDIDLSGSSKTDTANNGAEGSSSRSNIFSLDLAKEFTGNNEELAYELFDMLRAELDNYTSAIREAADSKDLVKLRKQAHKLHGASRCCGTTELKQASSHIESLIDKKANFDIEEECRTLLTAIENVANYDRDESA